MNDRTKNRNKKIKVWARIRPTSNFAHDNLELLPDLKSINTHLKQEPIKGGYVNNQVLDWSFKLDGIFHNASQEHIFSTVASDMVTSALNGYNATLMCYGQTGAGKTFTITGPKGSYHHRGMIPRALTQLYREIEERPDFSITVRISYLEIYNETMYDLLSSLSGTATRWKNEPMLITENQDGTYVKGLTSHLAQSEENALNLLFEGETNRTIAAHSLNRWSSRSHCIFTISIESRSRVESIATYTVSKLTFVDLAGSERLGKSKSKGRLVTEAVYINKSLSFLEQMMMALVDKRHDHVPCRQSKLTHYLKDAIGGNCKTTVIANIWGEAAQLEETISTLRFATRMMCVPSESTINRIYDPMLLLRKMQGEISHLKAELAMHDTLASGSQVAYEPLSQQQKHDIRQQCRSFLEGMQEELDIVNVRQIRGTFEGFRDVFGQMKKEIEEQLLQKFTVTDRTDPPPSTIQQDGPSASVNQVGETDGSGFGVGLASESIKAERSPVVSLKRKERIKKKSEIGSPTGQKMVKSTTPSTKAEPVQKESPPLPSAEEKEKERAESASPGSSVGYFSEKVQRPSTPPERPAAFEEFKQDKGLEINCILIENKEILMSKKKEYTELAVKINNTKTDIDNTRLILDQLHIEREAEGPVRDDDGDIIISEDEFMETHKLKELKMSYQNDMENLKTLKSQVEHCQKYVDQSRLYLLKEFDKWYAESFLSPAEEEETSPAAGYGQRPGITLPDSIPVMPEDDGEKFDRVQTELWADDPDCIPFNNAKMRTQQRKIYRAAMSQAQPSYRKPGTPTITMRNRPPGMLEVQQ